MESFKGKKILITGVNGFIGVHLASRLLELGATIEGTSRDPEHMRYIHEARLDRKFTIYQVDLQDESAIAELVRKGSYNYVFHLASQSDPRKSVHHPHETIKTNIMGTLNLLEAVRTNLKKPIIVLAGTVRAFYEPGEYDSHVGLHPYDASKMGMESIAMSYFHAYDISGAVAKNTNVFGESDLNFGRLIPVIMKQALTENVIRLRGDGQLKRDFMYVEDAVNAMLMLALKVDDPAVKGQSFTFATGKLLTIREVCAYIQKIMGGNLTVEFDESHSFVERNQPSLDITPAEKVLRWKSSVSFEEGMRVTATWYRDYFRRNKE